MKAAILYGNGDVRYGEYPEPQIKNGHVKIRVRSAGICGSDIPRVFNGGAHSYPSVLGHEFAGEVTEVGEGVCRVKKGDTVAVAPLVPCMECGDCKTGDYSLCRDYSFVGSREQGGFSEYVVVPEMNAVRYDPSVPFDIAAFFEPSTVALHGLFLCGYRGGGSVSVLGAGTIGVLTLQWARIFGARCVTAFDIDEDRLALARELGADKTVNPAKEGAGGVKSDYVFETAGSPDAMRLAFEVAAGRASLCFIGTPHRDLAFTPKQWENMNRKEFRLTGSWMSYSAPFPGREWELTAHYLKKGSLVINDRLIFRRYPLSKAGEAFGLYEDPSGVKGKVLLIC